MDELALSLNPPSTGPSSLAFDLITVGLALGKFSEVHEIERRSLTEWTEFASIVERRFGGFEFVTTKGDRTTGYAVTGDVVIAGRHQASWDEWTILVAAKKQSDASKWVAAMNTMLPAPPPPPPSPPLPRTIIPTMFWMQNSMTGGATFARRNITVQPWEDIEGNYGESARAELGALMSMSDPGGGGKLMLMHGPPGTGKTRAIMSLFHEWQDWCAASVVTDAERFFGDPTYLNDVIFGAEGRADWVLIVIEDGDEFIDVGQREHKGQAIARLLNMADGIVGQGLNLLTLITTNVPMDRLNPALARSGRCLADIHVGGFSEDDARSWLGERDLDADLVSSLDFEVEDRPVVLADLYQLARDAGVELGDAAEGEAVVASAGVFEEWNPKPSEG